MHNNQFQTWMTISNNRFDTSRRVIFLFAIVFSPTMAANINFGFELTEKLEIYYEISKVFNQDQINEILDMFILFITKFAGALLQKR